MEFALAGQAALICGGGGGFGKHCARLLVHDGAAVTLMGRTASTLERARAWLLEDTPDASVEVCVGDATAEDDVHAAARAAAHEGALHIVIGTVGGASGFLPAHETAYETFMSDLRANVGSAFLAVRCAVPFMVAGGAFAFISSTAAALSFRTLSGYCAGKAALDHFVRVAADELADRNIRLNCVRPGLTHTDGMVARWEEPGFVSSFDGLIPLGRTGEAIDIAHAMRYLVGPESSWLTGQSFAVDGGNELRGAPRLPSA